MLQLMYAANLVILVPVVMALWGQAPAAVFEGKFSPSPELSGLVASLWFGVLVCSALGLVWPKFFMPVLVFQVIYKATFLALVILPLWRSGGAAAVPWGVTSVFIAIVLLWPIGLWANWRLQWPSSAA